jgi:ribose 5-phosphate isomerase A
VLSPEERGKRAAGYHAADRFVRPDTCIGLGTGSTANFAIERVGEKVRAGFVVRVVPTSLETERRCREAGITLAAFGDESLDVAIDGADEVAPDLSLIKGGGGALFREKAVALAARAFVVIVTARKLVERLGAFPLPVEVVPYSTSYVAREIEALGASVRLRRGRDGKAFVTDNGNAILDCEFGTIPAPGLLDRILREFHGVVCTGLFVGLTSRLVIANDDGTIDERPSSPFDGRS